jgi:F-type H+-transporting ATPase subunit gamma
VKSSLLLVLSSNRGLCGGYNTSIIREAAAQVRALKSEGVTLHLDVSGKRAIAYCRFQGIPTDHAYTEFEDKPTFEQVDVLGSRYLHDYIAGKIDRVEVAYMKFLNAARQVPVVETLLPLSTVAPEPGKPAPKQEKSKPVEYEFLPSAQEILEEILPVSFKIRLFKCFLDAAVSEQIARRVAMKAATENAGEMIKDLSLKYNRARQAQITKELSEIIGGAAALK